MTGDDRPTLPPVRLPSDAELARDALAAPLLARAVELTRWARRGGPEGAGVPVGAGGELLSEQLKEAAAHLGLGGEEEAPALAADAWNFAVDTGLLVIEEDREDHEDEEGGAADDGQPSSDEPVGLATPEAELGGLTGDPDEAMPAPADILELWLGGLETVLADAATPSFEELLGGIEGAVGEDGEINTDAIDLDAMDWDPEEEGEALDSALGNLYLLTATEPAVAAGSMVPLPVLAASMIVPEDMDEPTDEVLEEVSTAMMRLDEQFRMLEPTGLVEYRPVDEALTQEAAEGEEAAAAEELGGELDEEDVSRYGMVRLTPLGLHGVRARMREAGMEVPAVGDLAGAGADRLLATLPVYTEDNARSEIEGWFAARDEEGTLSAARELLAAARGTDEAAPVRRLTCQQALSLAGPEAEPALREVLEDRELGGLARVWLAERGAANVPQPDEDMVFWLTVDTIAAQVATAGEPEELRDLVRDLVDQHAGFFDKAWRVEHPATGDVLETMGRVHPDKHAAKAARKAAFKARSR
ncbi:hypothetical protein MMF93_07460 [Streptomyces tubbatahanensis]|uniref:Uncharacterized protein n=1 Tax=Streptomyces tubbatahanensis TaxID=2923272 RepID=A0ABY3XPI0_9ACTN|nr:hypothetical protein [Streptomyces tubbatahanensis]UNS96358.1 hypothetical protein MMF93_07460 [Streptomyces tubbatahanensis]